MLIPNRAQLQRVAMPLLRSPIGRWTALRLAASRSRGLVLLYHRVLPDGADHGAIVPSVPASLFRRHLDVLLRIGHVVPLMQLLEPSRPGDGLRFSITFDDDHPGYVETALPALHAMRVPATFFLSGRALHGLPPYWWTFVEETVRSHGLDYTRRTLGVSGRTVADLAVALERSPHAAALAHRLPAPSEATMTRNDIRALARTGMTIGFHTLRHELLTTLPASAVDRAMVEGRRELADAAGAAIDLLAYPHGRASSLVADAAARAGYSAAFVTGGRPIDMRSDRFLLARWEPGALDADDLIASVSLRLLRQPTSPRARSSTGSRADAKH